MMYIMRITLPGAHREHPGLYKIDICKAENGPVHVQFASPEPRLDFLRLAAESYITRTAAVTDVNFEITRILTFADVTASRKVIPDKIAIEGVITASGKPFTAVHICDGVTQRVQSLFSRYLRASTL